MSKEEFVELQGIRIPKPIMDFYEAYWKFVGYEDQTAKEYLVEHVNENLPSLLAEAIPHDDIEAILENYGLEPYRELMGVPKRKEVKANE